MAVTVANETAGGLILGEFNKNTDDVKPIMKYLETFWERIAHDIRRE